MKGPLQSSLNKIDPRKSTNPIRLLFNEILQCDHDDAVCMNCFDYFVFCVARIFSRFEILRSLLGIYLDFHKMFRIEFQVMARNVR